MREHVKQIQSARGVYAALITPARAGICEPDTAALLDYIDRVTAGGVDGLVLFGSTGEFVHFDPEQRMQAVSMALKRSRVPVLVNVSHSAFAAVRDLIDHAVDSGAAGVLVMPPYFYRWPEPDITAFFDSVAETIAGRVPAYLYNLPQFTNQIPLRLAEPLLFSGTYTGIKDSSGDPDYFRTLLAMRSRETFQLLTGHEGAYQTGVDGMISGLAAVVPELITAVVRGIPEADAKMRELLERVLVLPPTIAIKKALEIRGWLKFCSAVPLSAETGAQLAHFEHWFRNALPHLIEIR